MIPDDGLDESFYKGCDALFSTKKLSHSVEVYISELFPMQTGSTAFLSVSYTYIQREQLR